MRPRTVAVLGGLFVVCGGLILFGVSISSSGGTLSEAWVSETPRDNQRNHHAVGIGPHGAVIVAPVAEVPNSDVQITNTSCELVRLGPENGTILWRTGMPAEYCFSHALTQPAIDDIDDDGTVEVVVSTTENAVIVYDASSGTEEWRAPLETYGYGQPTIANITADSGPEVVTSDIRGGVVVTRGNGSIVWRFGTNTTVWNRVSVWDAPVVDDIDGDTRSEVLVGSTDGPILLSADGGVEWLRNGSATYVATARVDDDPAIEVFTAGSSAIRAYDGASGSEEWTRSLTNGRIHAAADADTDGTVELYVGRFGGEILALDARTGETEWSTSVSRSDDTIIPPPVPGDVTGDGQPEVIAVTETGNVAVLDAESGAELASYERNVPIWTFATPADIDNDGRMEILVRYGDGRVVALDYQT
jgi:outer membrane protein assembly factor BamB